MNEQTGNGRSDSPNALKSAVIVGAGTMGSGIAQTFAESGWQVVLADVAEQAVAVGLDRIRAAWNRDLEKGRASDEDVARWQSLLSGATDCQPAVQTADIVVEAIIEDLAAKSQLFAQLAAVAPATSVLASNTSSISISALAAVTTHPERVVGLHFFNPAPLIPLVEIVRGIQTAADTIERSQRIVEDLGKDPVVVRDSPGFVGNRILLPMINEAALCLEEGVADADAIDSVMKLGMKHPIGPLALADLIGLDICVQILDVLQQDLDDPKYRPAAVLRQMVAEGRLGRKSGRGFFEYAS